VRGCRPVLHRLAFLYASQTCLPLLSVHCGARPCQSFGTRSSEYPTKMPLLPVLAPRAQHASKHASSTRTSTAGRPPCGSICVRKRSRCQPLCTLCAAMGCCATQGDVTGSMSCVQCNSGLGAMQYLPSRATRANSSQPRQAVPCLCSPAEQTLGTATGQEYSPSIGSDGFHIPAGRPPPCGGLVEARKCTVCH